jgi:hypothetical protein
VVPIVAILLAILLGFAAIALDGGVMVDRRRHVRATADAAALAAATDLYQNYRTNAGTDPGGTAAASALAVAKANGYTNDGTQSTVTVNIPPTSGDHVGQAGYVEVIIQYNQTRYFSTVYGSSTIAVRGRAVARGIWSPFKDGIMVLDPSVASALTAGGGGGFTLNNANVIVDSNNSTSVSNNSTGATLSVANGAFYLSGGISNNTTLKGTVYYNQRPTPDPLAYLPEPSLPSTILTAKGLKPSDPSVGGYLSALNIDPATVNGSVYVLEPGRYDKLPSFTNGDVVILKQASTNSADGIYYLNGAGFTSNGATIAMDPTGNTTGGVMLFNNPTNTSNSQGISINGGNVTLSPPTSGLYQGIEMFQERSSSMTLQIAGQGGMNISGTLYAASALLKITGSSSSTVDVIGSQYISDTLQLGGNGLININWSPQGTARQRLLGLVE